MDSPILVVLHNSFSLQNLLPPFAVSRGSVLFCEAEERYGFKNNQLSIAYVKILPNAENSFFFQASRCFYSFSRFLSERVWFL